MDVRIGVSAEIQPPSGGAIETTLHGTALVLRVVQFSDEDDEGCDGDGSSVVLDTTHFTADGGDASVTFKMRTGAVERTLRLTPLVAIDIAAPLLPVVDDEKGGKLLGDAVMLLLSDNNTKNTTP